jgi:hypothetical protein
MTAGHPPPDHDGGRRYARRRRLEALKDHNCGNGTCGTSCGVQKAAGQGSAIYTVFSVVGEVARVAATGDGAGGTHSIPFQSIDPDSPAIELVP